MASSREFFETISPEEKIICIKYLDVKKRNTYSANEGNKVKANTAAQEGMKALRTTRPKQEIKNSVFHGVWNLKKKSNSSNYSKEI